MTAEARGSDHDQIVTGILCRIGMGLSFSSMAALLKLASARGLNAPELVFYRSVFALPVVLLWVLKRDSLAVLKPNKPLGHVWRSALGLLSMGLTFQALILLPLADATAINFTAPIFATILSFVVLKEFVGVHRWAAVLVGFAGILIVARPGGSSLPAIGVAIALAAALSQAAVTTTLRHLQKSESVAAIVFWFAVAGSIAGSILMLFFGHPHAWQAIAFAAAGGILGGFGQLFMTASLRAPVSAVTPFDYLQIILATAFGWLLFADVPTQHTIIGAALITGAGLYTAWREHRRRLRQAAATVPAV
jgi:drug/metabolite transporter (DMT)-like permease